MTQSIKALTIHQPWAFAVASGHKLIENRSWMTSHRGPLLIHAGRSLKSIEEGRRYLDQLGIEMPPQSDLAFGAIVAIARIHGCCGVEEVADQPFAEGPICWLLKDVMTIQPFAYAGAQGLFNVPDGIVRQLRLLDGSRAVGVAPPYPSWTPGALLLS